MRSSSTGSTGGCRADPRERVRADTRPLSRRERLRRARRHQGLLGGLRLGRADGPLDADVVDHPLAPLEDADPVPRAPLPRARLRRTRQRPLRPPGGAGRLPRGGVRRRRAGGAGGNRHRAGRGRVAPRGAERSLLLAASHPDRVEKLVFIAPACRYRRSCLAAAPLWTLWSRARTTSAGGSGTATTGSSTTRTSSSSSSRSASASRTRRSRTRMRSAGASTPTLRRSSRPSSRRASRTRRASARSSTGSAALCS